MSTQPEISPAAEECKKEQLARKDPNHPIWARAKWIDLDATAECLLHENGNVLIYWRGGSIEKNIFIPAPFVSRIVGLLFSEGKL